MDEVTKYKPIGEMVARSRIGGAKFVSLDDFDAKCHAADVYFGSWKRTEQERDALQQRVDLLQGLMQEFCERVDRGEVRSKTTYAKFKAALASSAPDTADHDARADLACYFGLTRATWLTLPRVLMEAMPEEWKRDMSLLLNQYDETFTNQPDFGTTVRITDGNKLVPTPDRLINYRHPNMAMIDQVRGVVAPVAPIVPGKCTACHGQGTIGTGIDESPSTTCNLCEGQGHE